MAKDACCTVLVRWPSNSFEWSGSRYRSWADQGVLGMFFETPVRNAEEKEERVSSAALAVYESALLM